MKENILLIAIPAFFLLMLIEFLVARHKQKEVYRLNDTLANLNLGIGSQVFSVLTKGLIFGLIYFIHEHFALFEIPINVASILLCFILFDFTYYWAHRWGHEVNLFWGAHVVHHQSEEYNLSVALRQPWFHHLVAFPLFLPLPFLGFDPLVIGVISAFVTLYQFWIHTQTIHKLPKLVEFIFNTPAHHRVHHAVNPKYIDKNHGATLIIWDRLFGTFQAEEEAQVYGITNQFQTFSPIRSNFDYYLYVLKAMRIMDWKNKVKMIFANPGWLPEGEAIADQLKKTDLTRAKFNPAIPKGFSIYAAIQFLLILWGTVAYLSNFDSLSLFHQIYFAGLIILSLTSCSGILENKKWVFFAEYTRILLVAVSINALYYFKYMDWFLIVLVLTGVGVLLFYTWFSISLRKNYKDLLLT